MTYRGLVIGRAAAAADAARLLDRALPAHDVRLCSDFEAAREVVGEFARDDHLVFVLALFPSPDGDPDTALFPLLERFPNTRVIVSTRDSSLDGVAGLTDAGRIDLIVHEPNLASARFAADMADQVRRYEERTGIDDHSDDENRETFIFSTPSTDDEIMAMITSGIDDCLGYQPRVTVPAGVRLTTEGTEVEDAMLCLSGQVSLERESHAGDVLMHHASTGRIIGLLSLTDRRRAFFTSRTTTDVTGIRLTFEQLNHVIRTRPETALLLAVLLIRSLDRRLRRAEDIQIEKVELTARLHEEQSELRRTYRKLEAARAELMSQARFATLGELASGVAHELNNPIAAIMRSTDHILDDITRLLDMKGAGGDSIAGPALHAALEARPLSTQEARAERRSLTELTGDRELASRLVLAGMTADLLTGILPSRVSARKRAELIEQAERSSSIGTGLRNLRSASTRINSLVDSLRSYARPDGDQLADVRVEDTLEDTIRLLSHRLRGIEIVRDYADIPPVTGHPAQLSQVWTNLIANAADAMQDQPERIVEVATSTRPGWVRVAIADSGPGIPDSTLEHIFEPRFTTKSGRVHYGMGLGLPISRTIVERHGGTITLDSHPGGTVATVDLPLEGL